MAPEPLTIWTGIYLGACVLLLLCVALTGPVSECKDAKDAGVDIKR